MTEITSDEMLELASLGAQVLHPRAVEIARNYGVTLVVRSSWTDEPGTRVLSPQSPARPLEGLELAHPVDAVEFDPDQSKVALLRVPDRPGIAARLFGELARQNLNVDLIIQSIHEGNTNDIAFTLTKADLSRAATVVTALAPALRTNPSDTDQAEVGLDDHTAKISIAGAGMIGRPGVAAKMFSALAAAGINIQLISTSEVKVSCTINAADGDRAIALLCGAFGVTSSPVSPIIIRATQTDSRPPLVRGVALDKKQAQVGIRHVPDRPGMAAKIFDHLAIHGVSVDMIIQSQRCRLVNGEPSRDIAFTVALADASRVEALMQAMARDLGFGEVVVNRAIAKVSVVGMGMIHYPGVAARLFQALAEEGINLQMIATSEIKISCVVEESEGIRALQAVHQAFDLGTTGSENKL